MAKTDKAQNLTVIRVEGAQKPDGAWAYYKVLKRMERAARKLPKHDIVISMTDPPMLAHTGYKIARKMQARHIHWVMDLYPDLFPVLDVILPKIAVNTIRKRIYNAMKSADAVIPISGCMARYLSRHSLSRQRMTVIENWPERALVNTDNDTAIPSTIFEGEQKFRILYAGTAGLAHDFESVIKAAKYLQKSNPEIEFVFIGKGAGLDFLARERNRLGLDNIRFLPHQPIQTLRSMMAGGDVHLVTMKEKAAGLLYPSKFYAACAVGRPVIFVGPEECDIHKTIKDTGCGLSIRNGDPQSLIKAILTYRNQADQWFSAAKTAETVTKNQPDNGLAAWSALIASLT